MTSIRTMSGGSADLDDARLEELRTIVHGEVVTPDDPGYDEVRAVHNAIYDRRPGLVVRCRGTADVVDALALTTGVEQVTPRKARMGYRHVADKFAVASLTAQPAELVRPDRVRECPVQLECRVTAAHPFGAPDVPGRPIADVIPRWDEIAARTAVTTADGEWHRFGPRVAWTVTADGHLVVLAVDPVDVRV